MSAPNFSLRHNTKNIYAFGLYSDYAQQCKEDKEQPTNEGFYFWSECESDFYCEQVKEDLMAKFGKYAVWKPENRGYRDASILAAVETSIDFAGRDWDISYNILVESGRYDGWTMDYDLRRIDGFDEMPEVYQLEYELQDYVNKGLAKALAPKLQKKLQQAADDMAEQLDEILRALAPHRLGCTHLFSNGEAWYEEVAS